MELIKINVRKCMLCQINPEFTLNYPEKPPKTSLITEILLNFMLNEQSFCIYFV